MPGCVKKNYSKRRGNDKSYVQSSQMKFFLLKQVIFKSFSNLVRKKQKTNVMNGRKRDVGNGNGAVWGKRVVCRLLIGLLRLFAGDGSWGTSRT